MNNIKFPEITFFPKSFFKAKYSVNYFEELYSLSYKDLAKFYLFIFTLFKSNFKAESSRDEDFISSDTLLNFLNLVKNCIKNPTSKKAKEVHKYFNNYITINYYTNSPILVLIIDFIDIIRLFISSKNHLQAVYTSSYAICDIVCSIGMDYIDHILSYLKMLLRKEKQFNIIEHNNSSYEKILKYIINSDIDKIVEVDLCQLKDLVAENYNIDLDLGLNRRTLIETIRREF